MAKRITQETFDAAVRENMAEFSMEPDEALREAMEQFESQGVDLSNIVKTAPALSADGPEEPAHVVLQALDAVQELLSTPGPELASRLTRLAELCRDPGHRCLAARRGAYPALLAAAALPGLLLPALRGLAALTDGQPDLLDGAGLQLLLGALGGAGGADADPDPELACAALSALRHVALRHENNRRALVRAGVLPLLTGALRAHALRGPVVRAACAALRAMTLDDDVRAPFGHAHEHARAIVREHGALKLLVEAARAFRDQPLVLSELCSTLSRLAVRSEFCQEVVDLGGLAILVDLLTDSQHQDLARQALTALRAVAGNDDVKDAIVRAGGPRCIVGTLTRHLDSPQVCEQSCGALCALALRKPEHSEAIMEEGGAQAALQAMRTHPQDAGVQRQACLLLRNLAARSPALAGHIVGLGAEILITQAREAHPTCEDAAKAALRDLGCRVELRELWTGQRGDLAP